MRYRGTGAVNLAALKHDVINVIVRVWALEFIYRYSIIFISPRKGKILSDTKGGFFTKIYRASENPPITFTQENVNFMELRYCWGLGEG